MSFLLDTNAVSEPQRPRPDPGYLGWLGSRNAGDLHVSALTLGELMRGAALLDVGSRRARIEAWIIEACAVFADRVLPIDVSVAGVWAGVSLMHRKRGLVAGAVDELIAATAIANDLTLVTRNTKHFEASGCRLLSPWTAP